MHLYIDMELMLLRFLALKQVRMLSREKSAFLHYDQDMEDRCLI